MNESLETIKDILADHDLDAKVQYRSRGFGDPDLETDAYLDNNLRQVLVVCSDSSSQEVVITVEDGETRVFQTLGDFEYKLVTTFPEGKYTPDFAFVLVTYIWLCLM